MTTRDHDLETADLLDAGSQTTTGEEQPAENERRMDEVRSADAQATVDRPAEHGDMPDDDSDILFAPDDRMTFDQRWTEVQTRFVDDPRDAVAAADHLVAEVMQALASRFADHKSALEDQWAGGGEVETEELRQAMHRYRTFFRRLLAA